MTARIQKVKDLLRYLFIYLFIYFFRLALAKHTQGMASSASSESSTTKQTSGLNKRARKEKKSQDEDVWAGFVNILFLSYFYIIIDQLEYVLYQYPNYNAALKESYFKKKSQITSS